MPLKYTTIDDLNRRLDGRLQIGGVVSTLGGSSVTADLVLQLGEQVESIIDAILRKRYELPLVGTHPLLAGIVEKGVVCQLLSQYFVGQSPSGEAPADSGVCVDYRREMKMLDAIALPGEVLLAPLPNRQGLSWGSIQSGIRDAPPSTVQW